MSVFPGGIYHKDKGMAKKVFFSKCSVTHNTGIDNNIGYIYREKKKNEGMDQINTVVPPYLSVVSLSVFSVTCCQPPSKNIKWKIL